METPIKALPDIKIKTDEGYVVWFSGSNSWLELDESTYFLFQKTVKKYDKDKLLKSFTKKFSVSDEESEKKYQEFSELKKKVTHPKAHEDESIKPLKYGLNLEFSPHSHHSYSFQGVGFSIGYRTQNEEDYFHPLMFNLVDTELEVISAEYIISQSRNIFLLECIHDNEAYAFSNAVDLKKQLLYNIIHHKHKLEEKNILATVEASSISNGKECILFISDGKPGKSKLLGLSIKNGYEYVGNDYLIISGKAGTGHGVNSGISLYSEEVKDIEQALDIKSAEDFEIKPYIEDDMFYLYPKDSKVYSTKPVPVKKIVFVQFDQSKDVDLKRLKFDEALFSFFERGVASSKAKQAGMFIKWFKKTECFRLSYGNYENAIDTVGKIFQNKIPKK